MMNGVRIEKGEYLIL